MNGIFLFEDPYANMNHIKYPLVFLLDGAPTATRTRS